MTEVGVRRATVADAEELAATYRENGRLGFPAEVESADAETVAEWTENDRVFVARAGDETVGFGRLEVTTPRPREAQPARRP